MIFVILISIHSHYFSHAVGVMYTPAHVLSKKSARQQRNVFIWCSYSHKITMGRRQLLWRYRIGHPRDPGWRVDTDSPTSISTAHRWITTIVQTEVPNFAPESFSLFPVVIRPSGVLTYVIQRSGLALSRESQESIVPGDYGIYKEGRKVHFVSRSRPDELQTIADGSKPIVDYIVTPQLSYAIWGRSFEKYSVALAKKVRWFSLWYLPLCLIWSRLLYHLPSQKDLWLETKDAFLLVFRLPVTPILW